MTARVADRVIFNSKFNMNSFLKEAKTVLKEISGVPFDS